MATTHDVHRVMEENLFGAFQRQPLTTATSPFGGVVRSGAHSVTGAPTNTFRSLTASDLVNLPPSNHYRRYLAATSVTGANNVNSNNTNLPLQYKCRASSDILQAQPTVRNKSSPEAEAIDRWFENIQRYEQMLEEVAAASLDQGFKDELYHINQWLRCRSDAERTATLYTIVQNASQIQIRFLITVLQQLASSDNANDPYPAGQDNTSNCNDFQQFQQAFNNKFPSHHSVISTDSEYERRKRQLYPTASKRPPLMSTNSTPTVTQPQAPPPLSMPPQKLRGAMSEPDDLRRRNIDLFTSRPLGGLSHPGPLYEKALQARAQLQALNSGSTTTSTTNSTLSTASTSSTNSSSLLSKTNTGGLFSSPPKLRASLSTTDLRSSSGGGGGSLFSGNNNNDWPFPLNTKTDDSSNWSFGSLQKKKPSSTISSNKKGDDLLPWAIQEEQEIIMTEQPIAPPVQQLSTKNRTITASLSALEQAQARLRQHKQDQQQEPINPPTSSTTTPSFDFLKVPPPPGEENNTDDESDTSSNKEKPLTGLARRRKRSSAARALKDKLAAETVDFDLMQDVQGWLRSLRLHKYGHAFIGLDWKQVIRMSDEDMLQAGVNTIGARRKLLKVFENVQRHCKESSIEYE